jgi:hypothetical protein
MQQTLQQTPALAIVYALSSHPYILAACLLLWIMRTTPGSRPQKA